MDISPIHILVIDSDSDMRSVTTRILNDKGYQVFEAASGRQGLTKVGQVQPDLIIIDVALSDGNGLDICRQIKSDPKYRSVFIIILSAQRIETEQQIQGLQDGIESYISRPISNRELSARIEAFVRIKKNEKDLEFLKKELEEKNRAYNRVQEELNLLREIASKVGKSLEKHTADIELKQALIFNETIIKESPIGITIYDKTGQCIAANKAMSSIIGAPSEKILAQNYHQLESWKKSGLLENAIKAISEKQNQRFDLIIMSTFGKEVAADCYLVPYEDQKLLLMINDISDRLLAENEVKKSRNEINELLQAANAVLKNNPFENTAQDILAQCKHITGATSGYVALMSENKSEHEILFLDAGGRPCTLDTHLIMPIRELVKTAYDTGESVFENDFNLSEYQTLIPQGHVKLYNVLFAPLLIDKKACGVIGLANKPQGFDHEDTRVVKAFADFAAIALNNSRNLAELENSRKAAETANRAKSEFLANMSHELRTPINSMLGFSQMLRDHHLGFLNNQQTEHVAYIIESANRLLVLINDILDLSKVEAGKMEINEDIINVFELMERIEQTLTGLGVDKNITYKVKVVDAPKYIKGDGYRIEQVLRNLVSNAVKFTHQGKISVKVKRAAEKELLFLVKDTGIGIAADKSLDLFDKFYQIDNTLSKKYTGAGLGLAISKRLVELMGGRIWFESKEGKGSTFYFTIEIKEVETSFTDHNQVRTQLYPDLDICLKLKVLLAEDDRLNRISITHFLEKAGHRVTSVANGRQVLQQLERANFDVILMDVQMPEMDGIETTRMIRDSDSRLFSSQIPIIALTAFAMRGDRERFLKAGMDDYTSKPIRFEELLPKLNQVVLNKRRQSTTARNMDIPAKWRTSIDEVEKFLEESKEDPDFVNISWILFRKQLNNGWSNLKRPFRKTLPNRSY